MTILEKLAAVSGSLSAVLTLLLLLIRPLREKLLGFKCIRDGQKCLLRADMLATYYRRCDARAIRQHELENFIYEYSAYKALGGNSFIDKINQEVRSWRVLS